MKAYLMTLLVLFCSLTSLEAAWIFQDGKLKNTDKVATLSCDEHFSLGCHAFEAQNWEEAEAQFRIVWTNFPSSAYGPDSAFFLGVCCYELDELDFANESFTDYLKSSCQPKYFEKTMEYKFRIASEFRAGARRRPFCTKQLPKWLPAQNLALQIYDDIIQTMPCHEYAAQSLWAKGHMLWDECLYQDSIDAFQTLIRRFPKHELTPKSYRAINQVYLAEAEWEFQNPDLLQLAEINLRKFRREFPRDETVLLAEADVQALKETYAAGLWKTGKSYEWQGQCEAAAIYYMSAIKQFPDTAIADQCKSRLEILQPNPL